MNGLLMSFILDIVVLNKNVPCLLLFMLLLKYVSYD